MTIFLNLIFGGIFLSSFISIFMVSNYFAKAGIAFSMLTIGLGLIYSGTSIYDHSHSNTVMYGATNLMIGTIAWLLFMSLFFHDKSIDKSKDTD